MSRLVLCLILCGIMTSFAQTPKTVPFYHFCKSEGISVKYNTESSYYRLLKGERELRLHLLLPYISYKSRLYYMGQKLTYDRKGELQLLPEYVEMIQAIFNEREVIVVTNVVRRQDIGDETKPMETIIPKTNQNIDKKDDKIEKTVYNNTVDEDEDFQPINMIIIDAGHGGRDPGGIGVGGIKEKEIVLAVSKYLEDYLKSKGFKNILMTRKGDDYVSLSERTDLANEYAKKYNPIFISIHGNISLDKNVSGLEVYSLADNPSDDEAYQVQLMENQIYTKSDIEKTEAIFSILGDLVKDELKRESELLAKYVANAFIAKTGASLRGIKRANFFVLKYNSVPSILVEIGFMSNPAESKKLMNADYRKKMAYGVGDGIINFINYYNKNRGFTK